MRYHLCEYFIQLGGFYYNEKLLTITTLTAGLGATLISTSHQADAAEFQPSHQYSYQQQNFSQQAYQYHTTETNTTSTSTSTQSISTSSGNILPVNVLGMYLTVSTENWFYMRQCQ